ncbi:manganese efflux pump MntP [Saccharopolyspora phatthalungensis]|uniref:Putative Mn2+ efflux pump MntP n=1 Tax=Saccharopolyspora phatthalungensis TaxID=664693 RepID=A0A840QK16_9PSEU|nr:manganese efflux pump [Saccharopolyspora phatthalungensis]MBB5159649.1 putative Mn2+ efflux pump MntP [Saccharopolyspora phatthalungensis]
MLSLAGLVVVALSPGLGNFATSIALGLLGVDVRLRLKVACVFGSFETAMPLLGLALGQQAALRFGGVTTAAGAVLLGLTGCYTVVSALRSRSNPGKTEVNTWRLPQLCVIGAALSIDNLVIGFALGTYHTAIVLAAVIIGTASVAMSLLGLELGAHLGSRFGERLCKHSELSAGVVLVAVSVGMGLGMI